MKWVLRWLVVGLWVITGCGDRSVPLDHDEWSATTVGYASPVITMDELPPMFDFQIHAKASAGGPHGGRLIELGHGRYHAEWLASADGWQMLILDETATTESPIDASSLTLALRTDGVVIVQQWVAMSRAASADGPETRFVLPRHQIDDRLADLDPSRDSLPPGLDGVITIVSAGRAYTGPIGGKAPTSGCGCSGHSL